MRLEAYRRHMCGAMCALVVAAAAAVQAQDAKSVAGRWDAVVVANNVEVPFRLDVAANGREVTGSFVNGDQKITSTRGTFENGVLDLAFDQYATKLKATLKDGQLEGTYDRGRRGTWPVTAKRHTAPAPVANVPSIEGVWRVPTTTSNKGEKAWRFIARQKGAEVSGAILRVDGDTGMLTGSYRDGTFVLGHFSGARPLRLEVTVAADGTLKLLQNGKTELVAVREDSPRVAGLDAPTDPAEHTRVKDPSEPFRFSFPDLRGAVVANTDERFKGKVVLVSITGSWCPNCHDEAPFLASLYRKYKKQGLEIVGLSFEEEDQLANPTRLKAFMKTYGIEYPMLLAGIPDDLAVKVPQAVNLNAVPTTFILGRDGRVRAVHAGFPSSASGRFLTEAQHEITEHIERLLREKSTE